MMQVYCKTLLLPAQRGHTRSGARYASADAEYHDVIRTIAGAEDHWVAAVCPRTQFMVCMLFIIPSLKKNLALSKYYRLSADCDHMPHEACRHSNIPDSDKSSVGLTPQMPGAQVQDQP